MKTTDNQTVKHIPNEIRVHLPDQEVLTEVWRKAKSNEVSAIKEEGHNPKYWPEGATSRRLVIEDIEYFVCEIGGGRFERAGFHEQYFTDHTTPQRDMVAYVAGEAMKHDLCAMEGFQIDVECRIDYEYKDDNGETIPDHYGNDPEPGDHYINVVAFKHKPYKATKQDHILRQMQAYQHFLFYIEIEHIEKVNPWNDKHLTNHFIDKFRGLVSSSKAGFARIDCVVKWVQDMTPHNQAMLFDYIFAFHIDRY